MTMVVTPRQCASTVLVIALLTTPFIPVFTCGFVIPTLCPTVRRSTLCGETTVKRFSVNDTGTVPEPELDGGRRPPLEDNFYEETFFDKFALNFFRGALQKEIGYSSSLEGYRGLIDEAYNYYAIKGASPEETQNMVICLLTAVCGSTLPPFYRFFIAPGPWGPIATTLVTPYLLKFLVGPNTVALRSDGKVRAYTVEEYPPEYLSLLCLLCPDSLGGCTLRGVDSWRLPIARDYV